MPSIFVYQYINYKASIIGILIMLALNNINYKASIIGILIMLALKYKAAIVFGYLLDRQSL